MSRRPEDGPEREFLLRDFEHWAESYRSNEALGEARLSFFIGIVTAVLGGLGFLASREGGDQILPIRPAAICALLGLTILGCFTLARVLRRNRVTGGYLHAMAVTRAQFLPAPLIAEMTDKLPRERRRRIRNGGIASITAFVNASLIGIAGWILLGPWGLLLTAPAFLAQAAVIGRSERPARGSETFRAGVGLVVVDNAGRVLALERFKERGAWQLPQGGIDLGEEPRSAALRELQEETGLGPDSVTIERELAGWLAYELPAPMRRPKTGYGQVQKWFFLRLRESATPPRPHADGREAARVEWRDFDTVLQGVVTFKKPVYERLAAEWPDLLAGPERRGS